MTAAVATTRSSGQGRGALSDACAPPNATADWSAMMSNEVATASHMGSPATSARAGTTMKPPPAPTMPARKPATPPTASKEGTDVRGFSPSGASFRPRIMLAAVSSMSTAKPPKRMRASMWGAIHFEAIQAVAIAGSANKIATRKWTRPASAWGATLTRLVTPTTNKLLAMAVFGATPRT
jgi:hypothetical protein